MTVGAFALAACDRPSPEPRALQLDEANQATESMAPQESVDEAQPLANVAPAPEAKTAPVSEDDACPANMVLVEGEYCPKVKQTCLRYLDPPGRFEKFRCAEYKQPAECEGPKKKMKFCIDRDEYVAPNSSLPENHKSWTHADQTCRAQGKRVCMESEWNFACEGEEMRPYPYGFKRDPTACNADHTDLVDAEGNLKDRRVPPGTYNRCVSPFGVRDMAGNLEEFVTIDGSTPARPAMKGAYWQPSRNFCRAAQTAHDRYYNGTETGFRCCSDVD
ncbi:MAG: SUMF1/EgtB/PvdO family nonheme iron enzyme [Myxococcales bacterium]|nr:SUMF1/EgtB/PvdO family nonheme iron enzyme [Myxococcales bacterium]